MKISGFPISYYTLLRTFCSPGWDSAAPASRTDARLTGFWPCACALGPTDWPDWQPAQIKERRGSPRHHLSHFRPCACILPNFIDAMQPADETKNASSAFLSQACDYGADEIYRRGKCRGGVDWDSAHESTIVRGMQTRRI